MCGDYPVAGITLEQSPYQSAYVAYRRGLSCFGPQARWGPGPCCGRLFLKLPIRSIKLKTRIAQWYWSAVAGDGAPEPVVENIG